MKFRILATILLVASILASSAVVSAAGYPDRAITIVVAFGAGGGTDLVNRAMGEALREAFKVPVNVVNMPGGQAGIATEHVWTSPRDGYTLLGISETGLFMPANGGHTTTTKDWEYFMVGGSPGVLAVPQNSPYKTFGDLLAAMKAKPGIVKVAAGSPGGLWQTRWMLIRKYADVKDNLIGYNGSAPSITAALTGEVDVVHASAGEMRTYIEAGKLRPLVMTELEGKDLPGAGMVPPIVQFLPALAKDLPMPQWLGFAVPANTPKEIMDVLTKGFLTAMDSKPIKDVLASQMADRYGYYGAKSKQLASKLESAFCWTLFDLGMAARNPGELGIPKP